MSALLAKLTPRELEVVQLVVYEQASNEQTADALGLSVKTVETHRAKINFKLGVHSTSQLMACVYRERGSFPVAGAPLVPSYSPPARRGPSRNEDAPTLPDPPDPRHATTDAATERDVLARLASETHVTTVAALAGVDELAARRVLVALRRVREGFSDVPPPAPPQPEPVWYEPAPAAPPSTMQLRQLELVSEFVDDESDDEDQSLVSDEDDDDLPLPRPEDDEPAPDTERSPRITTEPALAASPLRGHDEGRRPWVVKKGRQTVFFPDKTLAELHAEARRQHRSLSWLVQRAWKLARPQIRALPPPPEV